MQENLSKIIGEIQNILEKREIKREEKEFFIFLLENTIKVYDNLIKEEDDAENYREKNNYFNKLKSKCIVNKRELENYNKETEEIKSIVKDIEKLLY